MAILNFIVIFNINKSRSNNKKSAQNVYREGDSLKE